MGKEAFLSPHCQVEDCSPRANRSNHYSCQTLASAACFPEILFNFIYLYTFLRKTKLLSSQNSWRKAWLKTFIKWLPTSQQTNKLSDITKQYACWTPGPNPVLLEQQLCCKSVGYLDPEDGRAASRYEDTVHQLKWVSASCVLGVHDRRGFKSSVRLML